MAGESETNEEIEPIEPIKMKTDIQNNRSEERANLVSVIGTLVGEASLDAPPVLTYENIMAKAEELGLAEVIFGDAEDSRKLLGSLLKSLQGRHQTDAVGRQFVFAFCPGNAGAQYPIRFL